MKENRILHFLKALKENNNRDFMLQNQDLKKEAEAQFIELLTNIIRDLSYEDPSIAHLTAKELIFRLNRDTRFSHDKSPYMPAFRAHISPAGRIPIPVGYYIHIAPGESFLGGGLFASQFSDATQRIRNYLVKNGEEFMKIINEPAFTENFQLGGEKLKNVPKGYEPSLPQSEYLKYKSWFLEMPVDDSSLNALSSFQQTVVSKLLLMRPFNDYLNRALEGFQMPER